MSPNNNNRNEIDYILTPDLQIFKDVSVLHKCNYGFDHRPVRAKIRFDFKIHRGKLFNKHNFKPTKESLVQNIDDLEDINAEHQYETIVAVIHDTNNKFKTPKKKKNLLSDKSKQLLENRKLLVMNTREYSKTDKEVKRRIRKEIRQYNCHLVQAAIENNRSLRVVKKRITKSKTWSNCLKDINSEKQDNRDQIMTICTNFCKSL